MPGRGRAGLPAWPAALSVGRRRRKWVAGVAALATVLTGLVVVLARPPQAQAFCAWPAVGPDCHCPIDEVGGVCEPNFPDPPDEPDGGPPGPGEGGGGAAPENSETLKAAAAKAKEALTDDACNALVSGKQPASNDARTRFGTNTIIERDRSREPDERDGEYTVATVNNADNGRGGGEITLWEPFYEPRTKRREIERARVQLPALYDIIKDYDATQIRALILLHEQAHLSGALTHDHTGSWRPNTMLGFMLALAKVCKPPAGP